MTKTWFRSAAVVISITSATVTAGCASQPQPRAVTLALANPAAAESPPLGRTKPGKPEPDKAKPDKGAEVYTCPMHPEVVSPKPGNCPKCGMKLVPKGASGSGISM